ncbi:hypothetical protein ACFQ0H_23835 [Lysobacter gummosus]|uniref:hypothetical protein n=1 Tax=Lysobacter gummosus TaxID=262324 RepID=UPI0036455F31
MSKFAGLKKARSPWRLPVRRPWPPLRSVRSQCAMHRRPGRPRSAGRGWPLAAGAARSRIRRRPVRERLTSWSIAKSRWRVIAVACAGSRRPRACARRQACRAESSTSAALRRAAMSRTCSRRSARMRRVFPRSWDAACAYGNDCSMRSTPR